jgi:predicted metalloprotease
MRFRRGVGLDPGEVVDARGSGVGCLPLGLLAGGGGGLLGLLGLLLLFGLFSGGGGSSPTAGGAGGGNLATRCTSGMAANQYEDCRVVGVVNSVQAYWSSALPRSGVQYTDAPTVLYSVATSTGCGVARSEVGPFYCPRDKRVYLDLSFFDDLHSRLGAQGGEFAQAYVIAHEYGHHVQDLLGVFGKVGTPTKGAGGSSVRLELQADCYAGVWAHHAQDTKIVENVTPADIRDALNTASAIGDDRIERAAQGAVTPDTFTHGTSEQRQRWFNRGYQGGRAPDCDTFSASAL